MKLNYKALCSSCRAGENKVFADAFVTGYDQINQRPFRGYLCDDHLDIVLHDGQLVNEKIHATGVDAVCKDEFNCTLEELCLNARWNPTLRGERLARLVHAFNYYMEAHNKPWRAYNY